MRCFVLLAGCAGFRELSPQTQAMEITWQSLHLIDTAQTLSVARDPDCYFETVSGPIIGKHPSQQGVVLWMFAAGTLHFLITDWLATHGHPGLTTLWQALSLGSTGYWVMHNTMEAFALLATMNLELGA